MGVLTAYIVKEVLKGSAIALILLLTLFNLFAFSDELKDIGKGSYGLKEIFLYLAFNSPTVLYELIPSSALLGSLFIVGAMANNQEIIAMRAAGVSIFRLIKFVMYAGAIMVLFAIVVGEFIAPEALRTAELIRTKAQHDKIVMHSRYGLWLREDNKFINVRKIHEKGELADIYTYELDAQDRLILMTQFKQATFLGNNLWNMKGVSQTRISSNQIFTNIQGQMEWKTTINPDLLNVVIIKPDNMSLHELFKYINFLKENNQKYQTFELAFWSRLVNPFVIFVMLMISIPFVVSIKRGVGTGGRMMIGIIIGMSFNIFDKIAGHIGQVYGTSPILMAVLPSAVVFCGAVYAVSKVR
ncbi:MAG: LPS export ABC transporter permease LptG [Methylococcales bacterium]|nr:LPS export ABC transporter permease LptG [Methylococcales bacterium]